VRGKILLVLGLGIGYVLGTRDGRARYNQMKSAALKVWNDPRVQEQVNAATEFVKENAPEVASAVTENVKKIAQRVEAARSGKAAAKSATPARKPAAKPVSKKTTPSAPTNNAKK
jgi:hypothetical protein